MNEFEKNLLATTPQKTLTKNDYEVTYLTPKILDGFFGYALQGKVFIVTGLPKRVERFVINHEIYHLNDKSRRFGWLGNETRANVVCGIKDPIGLVLTIKASLNKKRLGRYLDLLTHFGKI